MNKEHPIAAVLAVIVLSLICFACNFGEYMLFLTLPTGRSVSFRSVAAVLILCLLTIFLLTGLFLLINRLCRWFDRPKTCGIVFFYSLLVIPLLLFVLPAIEVPYELIPRSEMGLGYGQLIIQICTIAPAVTCACISGVLFLVFRKND
ncbi:MAG: hypothetical protein K6E50_05820 [Lachnospiraceae bacterium]|nr:hypothetical protein [Lachnospiraceae bacterium]